MLRKPALLCSLVAAAVLTNSCGPAVTPDTRAADEAAIRVLDERWSAAASKNDVDGTVAFYAHDAVLMPQNSPLVKDPKSIREAWAGVLGPNSTLSWKVSTVEVAKSGELGYVHGTYQQTVKDPKGGPTINETGKLVEIWKKQSDGNWKCIVDMYNSDAPIR